jgi:hypothetical protein
MVCSVFVCSFREVCELARRADGDPRFGLHGLLAKLGELGLGDWELAPEHSASGGVSRSQDVFALTAVGPSHVPSRRYRRPIPSPHISRGTAPVNNRHVHDS